MPKNIIRSPSEYAADKAKERQERTQYFFVDTRVLLAEDNPVNQQAVTRLLERYGCQVVAANNGFEALQILRKDRNFDLVFMDCQMPMMDGYAATRQIRQLEQDGKLDRLTVIAFTAHLPHLERQKCDEAGMDDFLEKPVERGLFEQGLLRWLPPAKRRNVCAGVISEEGNVLAERAGTEAAGLLPALLPAEDVTVLDTEIFTAFCDLMGDEAAEVLENHCQNIRRYLALAEQGVAQADQLAIAKALHPLKSASRQIGALGLAEVAARAEKEASVLPPVNFAAIAMMLRELAAVQQEIEDFLKASRA